jgi:hypothetical protein
MEDPLIYRIPEPPDDEDERIALAREAAEADWLFEIEEVIHNGDNKL